MSQLKAVIFGAIGTIAETSEIQRQAFNLAFAEAGLDWNWDAQTYGDLLKTNGGQNRLRAYRDLVDGLVLSEVVGVGDSLPLGTASALAEVATALASPLRTGVTDFQIAALHQAKTKHYVALLENTPLHPRTGVVELMEACRHASIQVAFCTSTTIENVNGIGAALSGLLPFVGEAFPNGNRFATIVTNDKVRRPKPAPDAYIYCLQQLNLTADEAIAIEDTPVSLAAATAAGITTIATPGATTLDQDFGAADLVVADLTGITIDRLSALLQARQLTTSFSQRVDLLS